MASNNNPFDQANPQGILKLEEEFQLTKFLINQLEEAVFGVGLDAQFVYVNDVACYSLGYTREELLAMTMHDVNPDLSQEIWLEYWETLRHQGSLTFKSQHQAKAGWVFPVKISVTYAEFQGRGYGCTFAREITQYSQAEGVLGEVDPALHSARLKQEVLLHQRSIVQTQQVPEPLFIDSEKLADPQLIFPSDPKLNKVFDFIEANYYLPISLRDVAKALSYSSAYLTDLVRRRTGQAVHRWITKRRMVAACVLLSETNRSVEQIAAAVGYNYPACFFRQFRQSFGITPQVWRDAHRSQSSSN